MLQGTIFKLNARSSSISANYSIQLASTFLEQSLWKHTQPSLPNLLQKKIAQTDLNATQLNISKMAWYDIYRVNLDRFGVSFFYSVLLKRSNSQQSSKISHWKCIEVKINKGFTVGGLEHWMKNEKVCSVGLQLNNFIWNMSGFQPTTPTPP